jgi:hypothetical protein
VEKQGRLKDKKIKQLQTQLEAALSRVGEESSSSVKGGTDLSALIDKELTLLEENCFHLDKQKKVFGDTHSKVEHIVRELGGQQPRPLSNGRFVQDINRNADDCTDNKKYNEHGRTTYRLSSTADFKYEAYSPRPADPSQLSSGLSSPSRLNRLRSR